MQEIEDVIGIDASQAIPCSAKTGMGLDDVLEAVREAETPVESEAVAVSVAVGSAEADSVPLAVI